MTDDELNLLTDVTPGPGEPEVAIQSRRVVLTNGSVPAMAPEDGIYYDTNGTRWLVGWLNGERVRRIAPGWI